MKKILCIGMLLTGLGLFLAPSVMALSIGFDPGDQVGNVIDVDIVVYAPGPEIVSAYDLDVQYDPTVLAANRVEFGAELGYPSSSIPFYSVATIGEVVIKEVSLIIPDLLLITTQSELFTLATVFFDVIDAGTSPLILSLNHINNIVGEKAAPAEDIKIKNGEVKVAPVPEPATILLLGAGLAGLAGFRRKKFNRKTH